MNPALATALQRELDRAALFCPSLGLNVTVDDERHGVWHGASGYSDPDTRAAMPALARCYVYSITKTFTAVRVLQLAESGAVALDAPIAAYLDGLNLPDAVTLRRLLNHTAGVPSYTDLPDYLPANRRSPSQPWTYEHVRDLTCTGNLDFEPGSGWSYSNTGYMLLAKLVEAVTGRSFSDNIREGIVEPLGLRETCVAERIDEGKLTPGYARDLSHEQRVEDVTRIYHPWWCLTGLIVSTTGEIATFYSRVMSGSLLTPDSLSQMKVPVPVGSECGERSFFRKPSYGLGLMIDPGWDHGGMYGHGGDGPGFNTYAMVLPDFHGRRVTLVAFCNTSIGGHPFNVIRDLLRVLPRED